MERSFRCPGLVLKKYLKYLKCLKYLDLLTRYGSNIFKGLYGGVDMGFGIERPNAEPHSAMNIDGTNSFMDQWSTLQASATGNIVIHVEHGSNVTGIELLNIHAQHGITV